VRAKASKAAAVSLCLLLIASAPFHAHASPPAASEESSPLSGIAHGFVAWLRGIPHAGGHTHKGFKRKPATGPPVSTFVGLSGGPCQT